ncbi:MAG TPA: M28 family metallopeptidase [Dehalococcoidia bacterium]|nr:M28 family metallopeptidase [Dehalococcoidia bacterium]
MEIGPRVAGTPAEITARDFLAATLRSYGYAVTVPPFPFDASGFLPAKVDAGTTGIPGYALTGSPAGAATGPLVVAGTGRPEDFPAGGARGAIVLAQRGGLTFAQKVGNAIAAGAVGVVIYNSQAGALFGDVSGNVTIPVVGISKAAGDDLAARAAAGSVTVTVAVTPPRGTAYNVIATPPGVARCVTITGGHYDSVAVTGGADDNASGTAAVLETARVIAARNERGSNCFALFSGEEFGLLGSKAYVASLSTDSVTTLRAMLNLDVVGLPGELTLLGSADLVDTARLAGVAQGIPALQGTLPPGTASDHVSFINAGIPAVMFYRNDDAIHTPQDEISRLTATSLRDDVRIAVATLERLATP